jgi:thiol-disulfide isomerase/thioredoxin
VLGLSIVLLLIALIGERFSSSLLKYADGRSAFKRVLGFLFIILGLLIMTGIEKKIETKILDGGYFDVTKIEHQLLKKVEEQEGKEVQSSSVNTTEIKPQEEVGKVGTTTQNVPQKSFVSEVIPSSASKTVAKTDLPKQSYVEFVNPSGFVNTEGERIVMSDFVGKNIILLEVMTYSCINCQRTFPYMNDWFEKYKDKGLTVIGLHTPEFAFEKDIHNVEKAMDEFGIEFPVVLDNEYETWNAYENRFWPRRYLIDLNGNIVFDHIGEGKYKETEEMIIELLAERKVTLGVE